MAQITITIPNGTQTTRVAEAICSKFNYNAETDGTKLEFVTSLIRKWLKQQVSAYESEQAMRAADIAAAADVENNINIS